jgi:predicted cupin superfamily sugar epimerase
MSGRADELVRLLGLAPHPEGGAYREIHRSPHRVRPEDGRPPRSALTLIYFLLRAGERSAWHRVSSDESWTWLEGAPLELIQADLPGRDAEIALLGPVGEALRPVAVVPAGRWQAARSTGAYTLVSCAVGPGFDFADFEMADTPLP